MKDHKPIPTILVLPLALFTLFCLWFAWVMALG